MTFELHPDLIRDCLEIGDFPLCKILLMNTRLFPWLILVPKREGVSELFDLSTKDRAICAVEINMIAEHLKSYLKAKKMNIAALGNKTPQLHIHVIARFENDAAWPNPVWGTPYAPYSSEEATAIIIKIREGLRL
jgi:diadenosine tetraphosphate (Ap4A) HIT family hydrolase